MIQQFCSPNSNPGKAIVCAQINVNDIHSIFCGRKTKQNKETDQKNTEKQKNLGNNPNGSLNKVG